VQRPPSTVFAGLETDTILDGHQDATFFVGTPSRTHRPCARTTRPTGWL